MIKYKKHVYSVFDENMFAHLLWNCLYKTSVIITFFLLRTEKYLCYIICIHETKLPIQNSDFLIIHML